MSWCVRSFSNGPLDPWRRSKGSKSMSRRWPSTWLPLSAARQFPWMRKEHPIRRLSSNSTRCWRQTYPLVHQKLKRECVNDFSLLYTWQGTRAELEPVMVMAHQDVVSADPTEWTHPPFDGVITDGFIWGRGTLDIKNQLIGIMEAAGSTPAAGLPAGAYHPVWYGSR